MDSGAVLMSESSSWMDTLDVLALGMIRSGRGGGGGLDYGLLQFLEFCGHRKPISHLTALPVTVISALDVSLD
jgi:hypothetical protein